MSRRTQKNVGVIGLGIIGSRVAENVRRRGFHVFVWNRTPRPFPNFVGSRAEVAEICDFIQIFVSDDDALLESIEQIKRSLKPHHIVMAHCTVAPHTMRAAAEIVQRKGAHFLDAPFTGSKMAAQKGELVYYIGGDAATFQRARPVLEASSKQIIVIGEIGQATTIKVATNIITATTVQATAEALALVHSAGMTPDKFAAAMEGNGSQSGTLAMKLPNMISGNFEPHFSTKHMLKDVQIASRLARSSGLNFSAMEAARDSLRSEVEHGRGDDDYSSVIRVYFPEGIRQSTQPEADDEGQQDLAGLDEKRGGDSTSTGIAEHEASRTESANGTETATDHESSASELSGDSDEKSDAASAAASEDEVVGLKELEPEENAAEPAENALPNVEPSPDAASMDAAQIDVADDHPAQAGNEEDAPRAVDETTAAVVGASVGGHETAEARRGFLSRVFGRPTGE